MKNKPWQKLADPDLSSWIGWVDPAGLFYPCAWTGHMDLLDEMQSLGFHPDLKIRELESLLVKFTTEPAHGNPLILSCAEELTPRQKLTVGNLILRFDLIKEGESSLLWNYEILRDGTQVRFKAL